MVAKGKVSMTRPEREAAVVKAAMRFCRLNSNVSSTNTQVGMALSNLTKACAALHRTRGRKG